VKKVLVVASGNKGKIEEIKTILGDFFDVKSMKEVGFCNEIEENGQTFFENALIKAKAVYNFCKLPVLSDDSGLCVDALNGKPGVFSARFAGTNATDEENIDKLLFELAGKENRNAKFVCTMVYYDAERIIEGNGEVCCKILQERKGTGGFGYDSVFFCSKLNKTFAEASMEEKNQLSHRKSALLEILRKLN